MGKKGSWLSAIKRVFTHSSKDQPNESDTKPANEKKKKKGFGKFKHGDRNSFIPLFGQPSSIEKILADAEREHHIVFRPPTPPSDDPRTPPPFVPTTPASEVTAETESLTAESPSAESFRAESVRPESLKAESSRVESIRTESPRVESLRPESLRPESLRAESPRVESIRVESLRPEALRHESLSPEAPRIDSIRAESARVESLRPESLRPESLRAESLRVESARVESLRPESLRLESLRDESLRPESPLVLSPFAASPREGRQYHYSFHSFRPEPTLRNRHASATKIQAVYRGYAARRNCRALRGLVRLQGVVRGQNVKRQTANAMKLMQLLVRVQTQIQSRRVHKLENQSLHNKTDKDHVESPLGRWTSSQAEEEWKDSVLTKEQLDAKRQRKVEAAIKRERAMAYAYAHKFGKATPSSAQPVPINPMSGGYPWWWNWLERQSLPLNPPDNQSIKNAHPTPAPSRPGTGYRASPRPQSSNYKQQRSFELNPVDAFTPKSTRSAAAFTPRWKQSQTLLTSGSRRPMKDDDSLISCPPYSSVPNYMTPTASTRAKSRAYYSNPNQRFQGTTPATPNSISNRRFSLPAATQEFGSFKLFNDRESISSRMSVDSTLSLPFGAPRKPFNRFV